MKLSREKRNKFLKNLFKFTAPIMAIFFLQLSQEVPLKQSALIALYALYAALSDFFSKVNK
jgi:hypothetical protein